MASQNGKPSCDGSPVEKKRKISGKNNEPTDEIMHRHMTEEDVGIRCYITSGFTPIPGVVKQRFSDFVVNEIDLSGEVVRLTSTSTECNTSQEITQPDSDSEIPLPEDKVAELQTLVKGEGEKKSIRIEAPSAKEDRKAIHLYIKKAFPSLCSNCIEVDGKKFLDFSLTKNNLHDPRNSRSAWPADRPPHLHFTLYKEFKGTMEAIDIISKYSGIKPGQFNYAGTKDKRAKTTQRISIHKVNAEKLANVNSKLRGMKMGNFSYSKEQISLGCLKGNRFKVVLRNVNTTEENLSKATDALSETGFINYFGMQRFGTTSIATYRIGKEFLRENPLGVVDLIMAPREDESDGLVQKARQTWITSRDAQETLRLLPARCSMEKRLMQGIVKYGQRQLYSALDTIPSYQSLVWNTVVSKRIEKYGLNPIVGDLVFTRAGEEEATEGGGNVTALTADTLADYTIYDVVVPLPGFNIKLPNNETADWMKKILAEDEITLETFRTKQKEYRVPGSYRLMVMKSGAISSKLIRYDDVTQRLVDSDADISAEADNDSDTKQDPAVTMEDKLDVSTDTLVNTEDDKKTPGGTSETSQGKYQAAVLEFALPASSYATMLLREIMRIETSARHHTNLNVS